MLDKVLSVLSWFTSGSSIVLYLVCFSVGAFGGWYLTSDHYQAQIAQIQNELQATATKEINDYAKKLSETTDALQRANARLANADARASDLSKRLLDANNREAERAKTYSRESLDSKYSECRKLLSEGTDLLREGDQLVGRTAVEKDALAKLVK